MNPLPIDAHLPRVREALASARAVVVTAAPGAGKTTRVPPALAADGRVILLQPRRVAARSIARRIALEQGWTLGREVGWQVRLERRFTAETRLLVATEGVLAARLFDDPLLSTFHSVVIDEFHERSLHADVGLALARQAWRARDDLRLVVMSATIDASRVAAYLDDCPVVDAPGRAFDVSLEYRPGVPVADAVIDLAAARDGAILAFLPGVPEIERAAADLSGRLPSGTAVLPLHGRLDADAQDAALTPSGAPRVVLATNVAETTLTVPDVTAVVDGGHVKVPRYDPARGLDSLRTERVTQDSADQRAGRAGRVGPGRAIRLWDARDRLRPHREPEILRVDLAGTILDLLRWGGDPQSFEWYEAPSEAAVAAARALLQRLGAVDAGFRLTEAGRQLQRMPLHPRLARLLLASGAAPAAARACAVLSESRIAVPRHVARACDVWAAVEDARGLAPHVRRVADDLARVAAGLIGAPNISLDETSFRRAMLSAYPDRLARRRAAESDRFLLASGTGARLGRESGVVGHEFILAVDVAAGAAPGGEALIRVATGIEAAWLQPTETRLRHELTPDEVVRAFEVDAIGAVVLAERPVPPDPAVAAPMLADAWLARPRTADDEQIIRRAAFAGVAIDLPALARAAAWGARRVDDLRPLAMLDVPTRAAIDRAAPAKLRLPSGRDARLDYRGDGRVVAAVRLQQVFGLADTPRLGPRQEPVVFELLAPNGRPVQITTDLRSFWARGYPEVRKALRARYPKHAWPEP